MRAQNAVEFSVARYVSRIARRSVCGQSCISGFTLIEIAIVLVVIGLLLGGVLKGQELINNAKVKSFATDFRNIPVMLYAYQDRFKALPGDDAQVTTHLPGATLAVGPPGLVGNGAINGSWQFTTSSTETCVLWQHLRMAGLATGPTVVDCSADSDYWPKNANGGQVGIQANIGFGDMSDTFPGSNIICSKNIPGQFVLQLDALLDDGDPETGSMRAILQSNAGAASSSRAVVQANPAESFLVCMGV